MTSETLDYVASTVAVIFEPQPQASLSLNGEALARVMHLPTPNYAPDGSLVINSRRDQVEVALSPNKVDVRDVGLGTDNNEKIPRILHGVWALLRPEGLRSFGINFVVSVPRENPGGWIAQTFLSQRLWEIIQLPYNSDAVRISYQRPDKRITIRFESGPDSTVIINFNASQEITDLPEREILEKDIAAQRAVLVSLLEALEINST